MFKIEYEPKITLGNLVAIIGFVAACASWYAITGVTVRQIQLDQAQSKVELRALDLRIVAAETKAAVDNKQAEWILRSLERLQRDRGIWSPPAPTAAVVAPP